MKLLTLFVLVMLSFNSYGNTTLPNYGEENLIIGEEKDSYLEALTLKLESNGIDFCKSKSRSWSRNILPIMRNFARHGELYKFENSSPLFILRYKRYDFYNIDFKIYVNQEMTNISKVKFTEYKITDKRVNIGTLSNPILEDRQSVKVDVKGRCY